LHGHLLQLGDVRAAALDLLVAIIRFLVETDGSVLGRSVELFRGRHVHCGIIFRVFRRLGFGSGPGAHPNDSFTATSGIWHDTLLWLAGTRTRDPRMGSCAGATDLLTTGLARQAPAAGKTGSQNKLHFSGAQMRIL